jgi:alkaline phosphatase D
MLFLDFWKIPKQDPRRTRKGISFEETQIIEGKSVQIIGLDTRYFRSKLEGRKNGYLPNKDPLASVLGTEQWKWLDETLEDSKADIVIILSSIQILATNHPYEKWSNFTADRKKLLMKLDDVLKTKTVVLISGDRHRAGLYQKGSLVEITASALNKGSSRPTETDPLLIGKTYPEINFGILDIQPSKNIITLSIKDKDGMELESKVINL